MIEYADYLKEGASPEYAYRLTEGQVKKGIPHGFARVVDGYSSNVQFGYWKDAVHVETEDGEKVEHVPKT